MRSTVKVSRAILDEDVHLWYFEDARVTQLVYDLSSLRISAWSLDGEIEIRLGAAFNLCCDEMAVEVDFDKPDLAALQLTLCLLGDEVAQMRIEKAGYMESLFRSGCRVSVAPHPSYEAWEATGSVHERFSYLCDPSGAF